MCNKSCISKYYFCSIWGLTDIDFGVIIVGLGEVGGVQNA